MTSELEMELYKQHRTVQDKYTYFLLASVGAAIAFALSQTQGIGLSISQIPLAASVVLWGASFFCGCMKIHSLNKAIMANADQLKAQRNGFDGETDDKAILPLLPMSFRKKAEHSSILVNNYGTSQFYLFVLGVLFYIMWHILEMYLISSCSL